MTDLKPLLDIAASAPRPAADPAADLARARVKARTRAGRRLRLGSLGLALATVSVVGVAQVVDRHDQPLRPAGDAVSTAEVRLVAQRLDATPYTFDLTPRGWRVQAQSAYAVTIVPDDGSTSADPDDFRGKLVILFDQNPAVGARLVAEGRDFWLTSDSAYTTISTRTRGDEPPGMVRVQYPDDAGWTRTTMLRFLGSVHVGTGALPGLG
jgi:hypothetical protein